MLTAESSAVSIPSQSGILLAALPVIHFLS